MQADLLLRFDLCPANVTMHPGRCPQPQLRFRACDKRSQTGEAEHAQILRLHRHLPSSARGNSTENHTVGEVWFTGSAVPTFVSSTRVTVEPLAPDGAG